MDRRTLLTTAATTCVVGVSGCQRLRGLTTDDTGRRVVEIHDQDAVTESYEVTIAVELLEQTVTETHPAQLQITITNEGPDRALSIGRDRCGLFNRSDGGSDDPAGLWLYRPEEAQDLDREPDRWEQDKSRFSDRSYPAYGCGAFEYGSGESMRTEYEVWNDYAEDGYFEPGTYRWEREIQLWDDLDAAGTEQPTTTFQWGFSLTVTDEK
jgi:hypothetical protein